MAATGTVPEQPLTTVDDEEKRKIDALLKQQEDGYRLLWALLGMYVLLVVVTLVLGFVAFRRISKIQESTVNKIGRNFADIAAEAKNSGLIGNMLKAASDVMAATAVKAAQTIKES